MTTTPFDLSVTDALLSTTRAVRKRLDFDRPVPHEVIEECLELALQAPTGSNKQGWRWLVVTDVKKKQALADMYRQGAGDYLKTAGAEAEARGAAQDGRVFSSAQYLAERMQDAPALVIPCIDISQLPADVPPRMWCGLMASIFPAVWSFQLALRARGLGTVITTLHLGQADAAAKLLGIPDTIMQVGLLPVAYTKGTDFKTAKRNPLSDILHWDQW